MGPSSTETGPLPICDLIRVGVGSGITDGGPAAMAGTDRVAPLFAQVRMSSIGAITRSGVPVAGRSAPGGSSRHHEPAVVLLPGPARAGTGHYTRESRAGEGMISSSVGTRTFCAGNSRSRRPVGGRRPWPTGARAKRGRVTTDNRPPESDAARSAHEKWGRAGLHISRSLGVDLRTPGRLGVVSVRGGADRIDPLVLLPAGRSRGAVPGRPQPPALSEECTPIPAEP